MEKLFLLGADAKPGRMFLNLADDLTLTQAAQCTWGLYSPTQPLTLVQYGKGGAESDHPGCDMRLKIVSDAFIDALNRIGAIGWSTYPVVIRPRTVKSHVGLAFLQRVGPVSGFPGKCICGHTHEPGAEEEWPWVHFPESEWHGQDLLMPEGTTLALVSDRVRRALTEARLTGLRFEPLH